MHTIDVYYQEEYLASFTQLRYAEIFVDALVDSNLKNIEAIRLRKFLLL